MRFAVVVQTLHNPAPCCRLGPSAHAARDRQLSLISSQYRHLSRVLDLKAAKVLVPARTARPRTARHSWLDPNAHMSRTNRLFVAKVCCSTLPREPLPQRDVASVQEGCGRQPARISEPLAQRESTPCAHIAQHKRTRAN